MHKQSLGVKSRLLCVETDATRSRATFVLEPYHFLKHSGARLLYPTKEEVNVFARVCLPACLSVCLLARLLKDACMDLDEMLRVDRCRNMDELVNF